MRKNNVVLIRKGGADAPAAAHSCEPELLGWLIYRPDTEEFLHSHKSGPGYTTNAYTISPDYAYCFDTERQAFRFSTFIDRETEILPLYDLGDTLAVGFS